MGCGGAERQLAWMVNRLTERGHAVVLTVLHSLESHFQVNASIRLRFFANDHPRVLTPAGRFWMRRQWLRKQIIDGRPDVVLSFINVANVITLLASSGVRVPVVVAERGFPPLSQIPWHYRRLRGLLYRRADAIAVQTDEAAAWVRTIAPRSMVEVIPNPVPPPPVNLSTEVGFPIPAGRKIVAMGRLVPEKGFDLLIAAYALIAARFPEWTLMILGDGPERSDLERQIAANSLEDRVLLPGQVDEPALVLRECDFFVMSSHHEGFPNALCEAMACGLPAVSFDCPAGPRNIIRSAIDGILVPAGDVAALASQMSALMIDEPRRLEMARRAPEVVSRFDATRILDAWEHLLRTVTAQQEDQIR
jgi:glycosyltransferase involved in cell wall biosynthesis